MDEDAVLSILRPDDWHLHVRDGAALRAVLPHTTRVFARAIVMPNTRPPITTVDAARAYRDRILAALPPGSDFEPLMTLYLTDLTGAAELQRAVASGFVKAVKYYPAGATTHSEEGVTSVTRVHAALEAMERLGLPLLVHGEVTDPAVDVFDREKVFLDQVLSPLCRRFPGLRVVLEHVSTREGVQFVEDAPPTVGATITAHHLRYSRNALFQGGLRPHLYCLPVLKREHHRQALIEAATSGSPKFFLGTDSAPHARSAKEHGSGCAGCFSAPAALELYAEVFEGAGALDRLEGFASRNGPAFYGLPLNRGRVTLTRREWTVDAQCPLDEDVVVPLAAGERLRFRAHREPMS